MNLNPLTVSGAFRIDPSPHSDERGSFARTFCKDHLQEAGIDFQIVQSSISTNRAAGTLRGMHYQTIPAPEAKLVQCIRGAIWDCILDLRPDSPTYLQWAAEELTEDNQRILLVPELCAHGFLTLLPNSSVHYSMNQRFVPESARAVRWDDPAFGIEWPQAPQILSDKDRLLADFNGDPLR